MFEHALYINFIHCQPIDDYFHDLPISQLSSPNVYEKDDDLVVCFHQLFTVGLLNLVWKLVFRASSKTKGNRNPIWHFGKYLFLPITAKSTVQYIQLYKIKIKSVSAGGKERNVKIVLYRDNVVKFTQPIASISRMLDFLIYVIIYVFSFHSINFS